MNKIRDWLYIGNYADSLDFTGLDAYKIGAVLQLAGPVQHRDIVSHYLPVEDGKGLTPAQLQEGLQFILTNKDRIVLVGCAMGISRSATFCIAALKEIEGLSLDEAYKAVKQARRVISPHIELWKSLRGYYGE